jgi:hypothetical protein
VALLHSFAYGEASKAFAEVATHDPACGMAQWGIAMSKYHTIWGPSTDAEFAAGQAAARRRPRWRARPHASATSSRDRRLLRRGGLPHAARVAAYEKAMAGRAERNPDDHEAAIFHALAMLGVAYNSPPDKSYARQKKAAKILNRLLPLEPEHPGIAHYMIHSFDYPDLAPLALPAARAYAKIAPPRRTRCTCRRTSSRAGHVAGVDRVEPRLGRSAQQGLAPHHRGATSYEALHASDYLRYAYLQTRTGREGAGACDRVAQAEPGPAAFSAGYASRRSRRGTRSSAALEGGREPRRLARVLPVGEVFVCRGDRPLRACVGAARSGDLPRARTALERLTAIQQGSSGRRGSTGRRRSRFSACARRAGSRARRRRTRKRSSSCDRPPSSKMRPTSIPSRRARSFRRASNWRISLPSSDARRALAEYEASLRTAPAVTTATRRARAAERAGRRRKAKDFGEPAARTLWRQPAIAARGPGEP